MKIATGLTLLAAGAIFAFAVGANPPGLNIHTVGWVIMLTGVAGILLPARASGWLRRRVVLRKAAAGSAIGETDNDTYPSYVLHDPAAIASAILQDAELAGAADEDQQTAAPAAAGPGPVAAGPDDDAAAGPFGTLDDLLEDRTGQGPH